VVGWFREHRDSVRWSVWAYTVATPLVAVMIALLRRLLPAPHRDVFLIGGIAYLSTIAVWTWIWAGLSLHADRLDPATARAILDVAVFFGPVFTGTTTTMIAPVTLLALRGQPISDRMNSLAPAAPVIRNQIGPSFGSASI